MKAARNFPKATVTPKAQRSLESGHVWVYDTEITDISDNVNNGDIVDVVSKNGAYLGSAMLSQSSKIRLRVISKNANDKFDEAFWQRRVRYAIDYRKTVMGEDISACRLIFGEADGFPGLTVDKFNDILVAQTLSYGTEQLKDVIFGALQNELAADGIAVNGIYERNESELRKLEGLETGSGWYKGKEASNVTRISENGILYDVDIVNGQKTGFFLDQKYNRRAAASIARGKKILDCFTHTGSFALNCAKADAEKVTAIDISRTAIDAAINNAAINGLSDKIDFRCTNVFDLLPELESNGRRDYDYIILDPPAFTKSRKTIASAAHGYKEINYRAMKLLPRGGYLASCSCSHFMSRDHLFEVIRAAAHDASMQLRLIEERKQSPDHPIHTDIPETDYLKFFIFQVV